MATVADSFLSSSARKMPIRKRADLAARKQHYQGRSYWVVKDPVGLRYYRFQEEEYAVLNWLDGQSSLDDIKERFEKQFPPQKITLEELQSFLGMLHKSGLIVSALPGQGKELLKRRRERRRKELFFALSNVLCVRFKGFDPERLFSWLEPKIRWVFSPLAVTACLILALSALGLVLVNFSIFQSKLPEFHSFFTLHNAFWLAITLGVTKILHEFGHGLSCKHFGGECHELGVMLLVLTPCLFCNVSDSWMLPNKWHRAIIGAAGMYVELVLASICTFIWWFSEPGLLNNLCLNVMFLASISTVIFNGNPLLRYDGYYILSDVMEIPNLRQKSTQIMSRKMGEWFLGMEFPPDPFLPERNQGFFVAYTIAAIIYRWVVMVSIFMFLYRIGQEYHLDRIGQLLGLATLYGMFVYPFYQLGKYFHVPGRLDKVKKTRIYASLGGLAVLVAAFLFLPLPHSVIASLEVQPRDAKTVYVEVAGLLDAVLVKAGDQVRAGQPIVRLRNLELDLKIRELSMQRDHYAKQLESLRQQRYRDPRAGAEIRPLEDALAAIQQQLEQKQEDQRRLQLVAPCEGTVLPPTLVPDKGVDNDQLAAWSGTPLDPENLGALLEAGAVVCRIGEPKRMEAVLLIDQSDMDFVRLGQKVDIKMYHLPHEAYRGEIGQIAHDEMKETPHRLSSKAGGEVATKIDPKTGREKPVSTTYYQAKVPLDDAEGVLRIGLRGRGKIHTPWISLGLRCWLYVTHTFNFRM